MMLINFYNSLKTSTTTCASGHSPTTMINTNEAHRLINTIDKNLQIAVANGNIQKQFKLEQKAIVSKIRCH
jgi:hypothetical protein